MSKFGKNKRGACKLLGKCFVSRWLFRLMKVEATLKSFCSGKVSHLTPSIHVSLLHRKSTTVSLKLFISQAKASRFTNTFCLKCPSCAIGNTDIIMKAQFSSTQGRFSFEQCFHDEVFFVQCDCSFHDLSLRHAYLSIHYTSCF